MSFHDRRGSPQNILCLGMGVKGGSSEPDTLGCNLDCDVECFVAECGDFGPGIKRAAD